MEEEGRRYPAQPALMETVLQGQGVPPRPHSEITPGANPKQAEGAALVRAGTVPLAQAGKTPAQQPLCR